MCGFLGEISTTLMEAPNFKVLLDLSVPRGPDQQRVWNDTFCQLGFNRLAILDTSEHGMQPMASPSGKYIMVYNGEIYNYKVLKHRYGISDSDLRSTSDSEVLVHLIDKLSIQEFADVLNGMFAIAIWNTEDRELYFIRDFAGIKPFFYGLSDKGIVFASQFDQIFKHPNFDNKRLRPDIMKEFFGLGYMSAPNTVFEQIYQVEPGQLIVWDHERNAIISKTYYHSWNVSPQKLDSLKSTLDEFMIEMGSVVNHQLQSDVPVATFLSSGYDSSLVSAFAKQHKKDIVAYTFGVNDSKLDESKHAMAYANYLDVSHVVDKVSQHDLLSSVDAHFKSFAEPFGDYSSVPTYLITQKAKKYATVMLSGDGGDELFWGYPRFRRSLHQAHWFKLPLFLRRLIIPILSRKNKDLSAALKVERKFSDWILSKQIHFTNLNTLMPDIDFSEELLKLYSEPHSLKKSDLLQYLKKNEFYAHMQRTLKKVDITSMANSVEVRVPFLDRRIIDFSNSLIPEFTITHNRPKLILKDALYEFIPIEMVEKEKKGFTVPIKSWLQNDLKADVISTLVDTPFYGAEHLDITFIHNLLDDFYNTSRKINPWGLWHLYAWQKWALHNKLV